MQHTRNVLATLLLTMSIFSALLYTSCNKTSSTGVNKCQNVTCKNGGVCNVGICSCPNGYEDVDCSMASLSRYVGTWTMTDSVVGSSDTTALAASSTYTITITPAASGSTDFLINGITGNAGFQNLPCRMQDTLSRIFTPFEFRATDQYGYVTPVRMIVISCVGIVNYSGNYIHGRYIRQYPSGTNPRNDTLLYHILKP